MAIDAYNELVKEGVLGDDVSYDSWLESMTVPEPTDDSQGGFFQPMAAWTLRERDILITNGKLCGKHIIMLEQN